MLKNISVFSMFEWRYLHNIGLKFTVCVLYDPKIHLEKKTNANLAATKMWGHLDPFFYQFQR